ncbi:mucin-15 [Paralichthys olivaceus]|uniref:mucin-15 n=1 Tax=Paralichthys olivaceus TaxID=8255 RepID=UPI0037534ED5
MELYLKITVGFLLIVQTFHFVLLQDSTDSPGRTIDAAWLRKLTKLKVGIQKAPVTSEDYGLDLDPDNDPNNDHSSGIPSGYMIFSNEGDNVSSSEVSENKTSDNLTLPHKFPKHATKKHKVSNATVSPTTTTTNPTNSSQRNMTGADEESHNSTMTNHTSTADSISHNSTTFSNRTHLKSTTLAPEINATQQPPEEDERLHNRTGSNSTSTAATTTTLSLNETSITSSSTTASPSETTETSPVPTTSLAPITPEKANKTDKDGASGSSAERGLSSDSPRSRRNGAWVAVLGTGMALALVGLVAYVILKKKHQMGFSHRKLVEVFPSDPVLRLDNSEPLDLNYGGGAYYNSGLQGDNIQMSNFPGHRRN